MMPKFKKLQSLFFLVVILTCSCTKQEDLTTIETTETVETFEEGMIQLGEKLENPYSVENMQKAAESLFENGQLKSKPLIEVTHYYVRFLPKTEQELSFLNRDSSLYVYDYPLLCKVQKGGTYYHDPELSEKQITWQYTVVPVDFKFSNIQYEILDKVFMEDEIGKGKTKSALIDDYTYSLIEKEAYRLTGNLDEANKGEARLKATDWTPKGTITAEKDVPLGYYATMPLAGAYVLAKTFLKTRHGYTGTDGKFVVNGSFTTNTVDICIKWERTNYDIRDGSYGQAYYQGGDLSRDVSWNLEIKQYSTPKSWLFAHIHHAAYTYYYENYRWGIKAPTNGTILNQRLHIAGRDEEGRSHYFAFNDFWGAATVVIYSNKGSNKYYKSFVIFGTTIHELAHASFWEMGYSTGQYLIDYFSSKTIMTESWSMCFQNTITNSIYPGLDPVDTDDLYKYQDHQQRSTIASKSDGYSPLFIDLIDNVNQGLYVPALPKDRVEGYTLSQLENAMDKTYIDLSFLGSDIFMPYYESFAYSIYQTKLKDLYNNPTEGYIEELFSNYE